MAIGKPRNHILIFCFTQDEYEALQVASNGEGARSLSDFARAKLFGALEAPALHTQDCRRVVVSGEELAHPLAVEVNRGMFCPESSFLHGCH